MRKYIYDLIILCSAALMLMACGQKGSVSETVKEPVAETTAAAVETEDPWNDSETSQETFETTPEKTESYSVRSDSSSAEGSFADTEYYRMITGIIDDNFKTIDHHIGYDDDEKTMSVYFKGFQNIRLAIKLEYQEIMDLWPDAVDNMITISSSIYDMAKLVSDTKYIDVYMVDELNSLDQYDLSETLLWVRNGEVRYNFADAKLSGADKIRNNRAQRENSGSYNSSGENNSYGGSYGSVSVGEKNALASAISYLNSSSFSRSGLIDQLKFEGYSASEAAYAVDNCGADWDEQAVKKAKSYLKSSSFSRSGLKDQLEFEGFTSAQAEYGVSQAYR